MTSPLVQGNAANDEEFADEIHMIDRLIAGRIIIPHDGKARYVLKRLSQQYADTQNRLHATLCLRSKHGECTLTHFCSTIQVPGSEDLTDEYIPLSVGMGWGSWKGSSRSGQNSSLPVRNYGSAMTW